MILRSLSLVNYKNIKAANIVFSPKINCFIGNNGVGKTNLLDAICYLSFCKSTLTKADSSIINHTQNFSIIEGNYIDEHGEDLQIYCGLQRGSKKHFKRNKKEYKRLSQHLGLIPLIFVTPADSSIISEGSDERRKLMDVLLSQLDATYIDALSKYNKALNQRNSLLKKDGEPDLLLLDVLENQMAYNGELIFSKRKSLINEFIPVFDRIFHLLSGTQEHSVIKYVSHCQRGPLLEIIQKGRQKDLIMGYSLYGIHRDDLEFFLDDYPLKREGSQGQSKTFLLALKLSQFYFLKQTCSKTTPLLLLDDIFDKLDSLRVERLVHLVSSEEFGQIFMTDTNRDHLDKILKQCKKPYKIFSVDNGIITDKDKDKDKHV